MLEDPIVTTAADRVIECNGFLDIEPLRIKIHLAKRSKQRKAATAEQLVWTEMDAWLMKLNEKGAE